MLNKDKIIEIMTKLGQDEEVKAMLAASDIQGLFAKCKAAGIDVTEGDITEYVISQSEVSKEELDAVSGGCSHGKCSSVYSDLCTGNTCDNYDENHPSYQK